MKKAILVILDGWGLGKVPSSDALAQANTPYFDSLIKNYPNSTLITFGEDVGLPEGQMGNSEVGHLNIGAGRVVYQELARINKAVREQTLGQNQVLIDALQYAKDNQKAVHLMGLVSDGGVHSHINHLLALCDITQAHGLKDVFIHAFMDGRDCDPKSGHKFLHQVLEHTHNQDVRLASVIGRYYAMDRDKRWERVKLAYDLMVNAKGDLVKDVLSEIENNYQNNVTDEFLKPMVCANENGVTTATIKEGDVVISFNFRTDRPREITEVLTQVDMPDFEMKKLNLRYVTMTRYDDKYQNVDVIYTKDDLKNTMGEVVSNAGLTQVRIAETEKYPHVTFFFSGGREEPFEGERRLLVASPKVATYDLQPEMSALEITAAITADIVSNAPDFICLNFANTDMVGHTGDFKAAMIAAETVDNCLKEVLTCALSADYEAIVIADHGNSDYMINEDGTPNTAHTVNLVPCIYVSNHPKDKQIKSGKLADVAPTLLQILGVAPSAEMDGESLI